MCIRDRDFDDLIMQTVELFKACPEVCQNYQDRLQYIMVDEYQDTNTAQMCIRDRKHTQALPASVQ